ncbi:uncharacterized protein F4807DRAFT_126649 [Annulohypoxylon truncatum]|uniref:uncharacterized protein n=1 Tax=Annulohypoxylon truncatum TaxID=327061 RepID=UPI0020077ADB|nr:uncharacterized protein F4807DRAFT_126649 [Annulohypoxylon truncatum]KAI1214392.1 hypothetical protein F4807DRAFT_126649 [Annulohypoxylon truncatum]
MSTGGTGGNPIWGFNQGAANAQPSVDQSDDPDPKGTAAGYVPDQGEGKSLLGSLKEALKPGDAKRQQQQQQGSGHMGDFTHDGRHGGVEETMMRGHRDYDESQEGPQSHRNGMRTGGVVESVMPGQKDHVNKEKGGSSILGAMKSAAEDMPGTLRKAMGSQDSGMKNSGGITGKTERNSKFDKFPATENYLGPQPGEDRDAATRVSAFDSQGSVGHQFSSEGHIGGTAQKVGGPFSKEGAVGRQFTDKGSVGGTVQDTMGHGDATRKGT